MKKTEKKTLQQVTEKWMSLERKTFDQRKIAEKFYEEEVMGMITESYIERNQGKVREGVEYLISSVGTSYEPLVLNILLLKPKRVHFLYTAQSEETLDKVAEFCHLKMSQIEKSKVVETESLDVYREIKNCYLKWDRPEKLYIDFTGGTKAMSTAAAMAGSMINVGMVYCGSNQYLSDFRKPMPGSEELFFISNPFDVFGDLEIDKAYGLFGLHDYAGAREKLEVLRAEVPDPIIRRDLNLVYWLAKTYEEWDALDFGNANVSIMQLTKQLERDSKQDKGFILADMTEKLLNQKQMLGYLSQLEELQRQKKQMDILVQENLIYSLMFTMYQNALVRQKQEKYDMATLLLYRLLEMIEQRRLAYYGLYASKMNYMDIQNIGNVNPRVAHAQLKERVMEIKRAVFGKPGNGYLAEQVSLLEGFIILAALNDDLMKADKEIETINKLKRIRAMVSLRNNSIFAHGIAPVKEGDFKKFKQFVEELFVQLCRIEQIDYEAKLRDIKWISPMDSIYYKETR